MKKTLVVSLGNELVPEDGLGVEVVRALADNPNLPDDVEIIDAGTDLLRVADRLRDRELIVLVDAALTDAATSDWPVIFEHGTSRLDDTQQHAHHLSAVQALELIRWSDESVRQAQCLWFLLPVNRMRRAAETAL